MRKLFGYLKIGLGIFLVSLMWAISIVLVSYSQIAIVAYCLFCYVLCHYIEKGIDPFMSFYEPFFRCLTYIMFAVPWVTYLLILQCVSLVTGVEE